MTLNNEESPFLTFPPAPPGIGEIHPPPPLTTPREAPWREIEAIIDGLKAVTGKLDELITKWEAPPLPPAPEVVIKIDDLIKTGISLDIRTFLIMLYRLGRAIEVRLFSYIEIDALGTERYTYTIPNDRVYIPHIEEINLGLQRVMTRYDYEGGNIINTERYATDRTVEWTMTPLARVITGSFGISFYNDGATDTWIKSRFLGTLMRESDFLLWRKLVRALSGKYLEFTA